MWKRFCLYAFVVLALFVSNGFGQIESQARDNPEYERIKLLRTKLGVYKFSGTDYPAMFAIIAGISIVLVLAVVFIVAGLLSMEPSKDSIIYRMTMTRMKKD